MTKKKEPSRYDAAMEKILKRLDASGLPWPSKPKDYGEEYTFPTDPGELTHKALGQMQARLAAWLGYAHRLLGMAESEYDVFKGIYKDALSMKMLEITERGGSKGQLKDTLTAKALSEEEALHRASLAMIEREAYIRALKAQVDIYELQSKNLSREQTKRSDELRRKTDGHYGS